MCTVRRQPLLETALVSFHSSHSKMSATERVLLDSSLVPTRYTIDLKPDLERHYCDGKVQIDCDVKVETSCVVSKA